MAINKKLISFATQAQFDAYLANNNIDPRSIVFIEDKKRIWTHGVFFDTSWDYVTNKPNTLGGYEITDAYTKAEVDSLASYVGGYNFTNGFLVKTNVARTENSMLVLHIKGNSYGGVVPINTFVQVYNYRSSDAIINTGALNNGYKINEVKAFYYNNLVYFWVPQQTSFMTMTFQLLKAEGQVNRVDSVTNAAVPSSGVEKMVTITPRTAWFEDTLTNLSQLTDNIGVATHIANKSNPHAVTKAQVGLGNVLNVASYSKTESDGKYLPLSGGTLSNSTFGGSLTIHRIAANNSTIKFTATSGNPWYIGMDVVTGEFGVVDSAVGITTSKVKLNGSSGLVTGTGFSKTGATDAHMLLGGGGHKAISDFVPKAWTGAGDGAEIWMKSDVTTAGHSLGLHFTNSTNSTTATYQSRIQSRRGSGNYSDLIFSIRDTDIMLEILGQDRRVNILNQLTVQNNEVYHTGNLNISNFNASLVTSTSTAGITNVNTTNSNTYLNLIQGTSVASSTQIVGSNGVTVSSDTTGKLTITGLGAHAGIYSSRANGLGASSNSIEAKDTRSTNPLPNTDLQRGVWFDFKTNSAIGLTGASTYSSVITMVPYGDNSGNSNTSFRLAQSGNNLYFQNWTTVWGTWNKLWHSGNFANGNTTQYIRGDGSLATYSDTTYSLMTAAEASTGTATTARTINAKVLADEINRRGDLRYLSLSGGVLTSNASLYTQAFNSHLNLKQSDQVDGTFVGISYSSSMAANYGWSAGAIRKTGGNSDFVFKNHVNSIEGVERVRISGSGTVTADTFIGALSGNADSATKLQTARTINGTSFNGTANITTTNWGTARTLTIGSTGKSVNGSADVSWTLAEIGAAEGDNVSYKHDAGSGARWIRIAEFSHYNSYGIISILNSYSNNPPNSVTFYYNSGYRSASSPSITQIGGRAGIFTKARVVYPTATNEPGFIEVYYNTTSVGNTLYLRLTNSFNCKLLRTATVGEVPSTHTSYERNFTSGGISADTISANTFYGALSGNATTATTLATARTINGTSFNGSANITTANWGTARNIGIVNSDGTGTAVTTSVNGSANVNLKLPSTIKATLTGNASTATKLQTARTIAGVSFDGTANIAIPFANLASKPTTLSGYEITDAVQINSSHWANFRYANFSIDNKDDVVNVAGSLKLDGWYNISIGAEKTYGTRLTINGQSAHDKTQLYFNGNNGSIQYRKSWYNNSAWTALRTIWDSNNLSPVTTNTTQTITGAKTFDANITLGVNRYIQGTDSYTGVWNVDNLLWRFGSSKAGSVANIRSEKVGIGTDSPLYKLDVSGTGRFTGNVTAPTFIGNLTGLASLNLPLAGGTMTGILTAQNNTSYTTKQVRNIILSPNPVDSSAMGNGDIWITYE